MRQAIRHHLKLVIGGYALSFLGVILVFAGWTQTMGRLQEMGAPGHLQFMVTFVLVWFTTFAIIYPFLTALSAHRRCEDAS